LIPRVVLERVAVPGGELVLAQRGDEISIRVGGVELMNSRDHSSEDELGKQSAARITAKAPRVLIGGLGFGFTLRAALDALPAEAHLDVVELVPAIIRWNRTILGHLAGNPLTDPRVTVIEDDVGNVIKNARGYDAIVLDVDNGPDPVYDGNADLYKRRGLSAAKAALAPGGCLAVWSAFSSKSFTTWLRDVGFTPELVTLKSKFKGGPTHYVWFATKRAAASPSR
jgi:spermidine synthase